VAANGKVLSVPAGLVSQSSLLGPDYKIPLQMQTKITKIQSIKNIKLIAICNLKTTETNNEGKKSVLNSSCKRDW
jgi:hypothetical protein